MNHAEAVNALLHESYHERRESQVNLFQYLTFRACIIGIIAIISRKALTPCHMSGSFANGIDATLLKPACMLAASLVTNLLVLTFIMRVTTRLDLNYKKKTCIRNGQLQEEK